MAAMTRHETLDTINKHLGMMNTEGLERLLSFIETETLEITPGTGGKIGKHKPVTMKSERGSEHIIREARDKRENAL
jgi:hypothetical protein